MAARDGSQRARGCRYATEVDVDFVRKAVRAIGRCAIKVEQSAERCVSTLLDLIQTKVNYVVQEAIVVIKVRRSLFALSGIEVAQLECTLTFCLRNLTVMHLVD